MCPIPASVVNPQGERGDHTEETRARTASGPIQVGVILGIAVDLFAVGGDELQSKHALTRRPDDLAVPAVSALQQIAAEANAFAVPGGKEQALRVKFIREDTGDLAGPDARDHPIGVDVAVIEAADVEQHAAVAQMAGIPAVPARTNTDAVAVSPCVAQCCSDVSGLARLHDHSRKAFRQNTIPHRCAAGCFIFIRTAEEEPLFAEQRHFIPLNRR